MGAYFDSMSRRREWTVSQDDRQSFLGGNKFSKYDLAQFSNEESSVANQCLLRLQRICDSFQQSNVLLNDRISVSSPRIWDLQIYKDDPSRFPIQNVQIKCNILSTMSDLVRNRRKDDVSDASIQKVVKVLDYLRKLADAAAFDGFAKQPKVIERIAPVERYHSKGPRHGSFPARSENHLKATKTVRANAQKKKDLCTENINKFHEYRPLIISLQHRLTMLDTTNHRNDIIFNFVLQDICKFILDDCKLLLADYIEQRLLQI